jgi:hypothetical protein
VPELPHAAVELDSAEAAEVLEGDGYTRYLKPFRTLEDVHVHAALLGSLVSLARRLRWPDETQLELAQLAATALALSAAPHDSPATHLQLAAFLKTTRALVDASDNLFGTVATDERERWQRDRPLLDVAGRARKARLERAWAWARGEAR